MHDLPSAKALVRAHHVALARATPQTIAKELAQEQGGDLRLERTSPSGTVFTVTLRRHKDSDKKGEA